MGITRKTGMVLSLESRGRNAIQDTLGHLLESIDAIFLKQPILLWESIHIIAEIKDFSKEKGLDKPIIVDSRLDQGEVRSVEDLSELFKKEGAFGMTILGIYGDEFVKSCVHGAKIPVYSIVDIGTQFFRNMFTKFTLVENARIAIKNECQGIIMTGLHLERIRNVRSAIGKDFQIFSTFEKGCNVGDSISAGADFEIVPEQFFK